MLSHQKLKVYNKALAVVATLSNHSAPWNKRHAVVDQLYRAAESIILNIAEAARLRRCDHKQQFLDYARFLEMAEGSAVKAAAYLDLCGSKAQLCSQERELGLERLARVASMVRALSGGRG
jgi:four helix bundle protein